MATTTSSPPSPNPNPNLEGILTLALPAPTAPSPSTASRPAPTPPSSASGRRFPAPCWSHEETLALIESYRDKWLSLRRGNLRAPHWQEVADTVASRCHHLLSSVPAATSLKTSVQCRHKIEKLRKRYRAERQRSLRVNPTSPPQSSWVFFRIMDGMDPSGGASAAKNMPPQPPVAAAAAPARSSSSSSLENSSSDGIDDEEDEDGGNNWMGNGRGGAPGSGFRFKFPKGDRVKNDNMPTPMPMPMPMPTNFMNGRRFFEGYKNSDLGERRRREEKEQEDGSNVVGEIAAAVRMLGEGFLRIERMKMDMSREFEKVRMEMELKRTQMILDSYRMMVDAFVEGLVGRKRKKRAKMAREC